MTQIDAKGTNMTAARPRGDATVRFTIRLPEEMARRLTQVAALRSDPVNTVVISAVGSYLNRHEGLTDLPIVQELLDQFLDRYTPEEKS